MRLSSVTGPRGARTGFERRERHSPCTHDEWGREARLGPPFEVLEPVELPTPIVFDSPHSGARYPRHFLEASRLDAQTLRRSEDAFVDELVAPCVAIGAPLLRAFFPRAYLDVNREPFELDPQMFEGRLPDFPNTRSLRVAAGLGAIPRVVGDAQPIYRGPIRSRRVWRGSRRCTGLITNV